MPAGLRQHAGKNVGDIDDRGDQKYLFRALVTAPHHHVPDQSRAKRNGDELRHMKQLHRPCNADELRDHVGVVDDDQQYHQHKRQAQSELLANQVAQALARDHAHARTHLLHHDQGDGNRNHGPQQRVAVLCACLRIGENAARVVVDVGGDESRAEHGQKQEYPDSPTLAHARRFLRGIHLDFLNEHIRRGRGEANSAPGARGTPTLRLCIDLTTMVHWYVCHKKSTTVNLLKSSACRPA